MDSEARQMGVNGLIFERRADGGVCISPEKRNPNTVDVTLDASSWTSVVLTMSSFNERPGDWDKWMRHHLGKADMLPDLNYRGAEPWRRADGFPRRACLDLMHPAEKAIFDAVGHVELVGADVRLTTIVNRLTEARGQLADYLESLPIGSRVGQNLFISPDREFKPGPGDTYAAEERLRAKEDLMEIERASAAWETERSNLADRRTAALARCMELGVELPDNWPYSRLVDAEQG